MAAAPGATWTMTDENVRDLHRALLGPGDHQVVTSRTAPVLPTEEKPAVAEPGGFRRHFLRERGLPTPGESLVERLADQSFLARVASYAEYPYGLRFDDEGRLLAREERRVVADASPRQVGLAIFKAFVAEGIMFLPGAFKNGGWLVAPLAMFAVAYVSRIGIYMLVACYGTWPGSFGDIAEAAVGRVGRVAVDVSLVLSQFAICCAMLIFSLQALETAVGSGGGLHFRARAAAALVVLLVPLSWVRRIQRLAVSNLVANACILAGIGVSCGFFLARVAGDGVAPTVQPVRLETLAMFVGTTCYTFEGIPLVLPIYESMRDKDRFSAVFDATYWLAVALLETGYGLVGYLAFGQDINPVAILSIPLSPFTRAVMAVFSAAVCLSFPMMFVPAARILESGIQGSGKKWTKNGLRTGLVLGLTLVSLLFADYVEQFVAVAGSICCVPLAFVYPAVRWAPAGGEGWERTEGPPFLTAAAHALHQVFHQKLVGDKPWTAVAMIAFGLALIPVTLWQSLQLGPGGAGRGE